MQAARLRRGQACTSCRPSIASLSTRRLWTRPLKVLQRLSPEELREIEDGHVKLALLRQVRRSSNRSTQTRWPQRLFGLPLRARSFGTSTPIVAGRTQSEEGGCCAQPATAADRKNQSSPTSPRTSSATAPGGRCDRSPTEGSPTSRTGAPTTKEPTICRTGGSAAPSPMRRTAARASPSRRSRRHLKRSGGLAASSRPTGADRGAAAPARRPPAHRTGGVVCAIRASHGYGRSRSGGRSCAPRSDPAARHLSRKGGARRATAGRTGRTTASGTDWARPLPCQGSTAVRGSARMRCGTTESVRLQLHATVRDCWRCHSVCHSPHRLESEVGRRDFPIPVTGFTRLVLVVGREAGRRGLAESEISKLVDGVMAGPREHETS